MTNSGPADNTNQTDIFRFSAADRARIKSSLLAHCTFLPGDSNPDEIIDSTEENQGILDAGFGSLIKVPHTTEGVERFDGTIHGYVGRMNCAFFWYGGTKQYPSIMLGAEEHEDGILPCVITKKTLNDADGNPSVNKIIDFVESFNEKENPPGNPIYRLRFLRVHPKDGSKPVPAIACETDPNGPLFIGDKLSLDEKAILMANEWGMQFLGVTDQKTGELVRDESGKLIEKGERKPHQRTIYSYYVEMIDARLQKGFPVEQELWDLLHQANYYREQMPGHKREFLEAIESGIAAEPDNKDIPGEIRQLGIQTENDGKNVSSIFRMAQQKRRNLDPRVFESSKALPGISPEDYEQKLHNAREKLSSCVDFKALGIEKRNESRKTILDTDFIGKPAPCPS